MVPSPLMSWISNNWRAMNSWSLAESAERMFRSLSSSHNSACRAGRIAPSVSVDAVRTHSALARVETRFGTRALARERVDEPSRVILPRRRVCVAVAPRRSRRRRPYRTARSARNRRSSRRLASLIDRRSMARVRGSSRVPPARSPVELRGVSHESTGLAGRPLRVRATLHRWRASRIAETRAVSPHSG